MVSRTIPEPETKMQPSRDITRLIEIMAALRDPVGGCPWDLEQDFSTIRHYTIEEAYEVADAIERQDFADLREELGDLLLQPIYHAQMASEAGHFDIGDVIYAITDKLIRRHPHVFGDVEAGTSAASEGRWEVIKAQERAAKAARKGEAAPSILDDVPNVLPALARAGKLTKRAAKVGFDWPDFAAVKAKVDEELDEVAQAQASGDTVAVHEEIGDLLFAVANLARHAGIDPEAALRDANFKFTRRFLYVEERCREDGVEPKDAGLEQLDSYWNEIRAADKAPLPVDIRPAEPRDVEGIFQVRTSVTENTLTVTQLAEFGITKASITAMILSAPCAWVAVDREKVVGFSMVDLDEGSLFAAFVLPSYEGKGLGKKLVQAAEDALFRRHQVAWLKTGKATRAAGFYRHLGWGNETDVDGGEIRFEKSRT